MQRADSLEKTLMLGEIEGGRRRGRQRMRWLNDITVFDGHEFEQTLGDSDGWGSLACCSPWSHKESDMTERLNSKKYFKVKTGQKNHCLVLIVVGKICLIEVLTPEPWGHDFSVKLPLSVSPYLLWDLSVFIKCL